MRVEKFQEKRIYQVSAKEIKSLVAPALGSEWTIANIEAPNSLGAAYLVVTLERYVDRTVESGQES